MDRRVTDAGCLVFFGMILLAMLSLTLYGFFKGNIFKLIGGIDGDHNICGSTPGYERYKYLYITKLNEGDNLDELFKRGVCVKECPSTSSFALDCMPTEKVKQCNSDDVVKHQYNTFGLVSFCIPRNVSELPENYQVGWNKILENLKEGRTGRAIQDLQVSAPAMLSVIALGFILSILYIYAMSRFSRCMAIFSLIMIFVLLAATSVFNFIMAFQNSKQKNVYLIVGAVFALVTIIYLLVIWCQWKSVEIAIAIIDATADFYAATKRLVFVAMFYFIVTVLVTLLFVAAIGGVISLNDITASPTSPQGRVIVWKTEVFPILAFMTFGFIWGVFWIQAKTGFICMVAASNYYFTSSKQNEGEGAVLTGMRFAYLKHAGSLAYGTLLHAIITVIRILAEAADGESSNSQARAVAACIKCLLSCIE